MEGKMRTLRVGMSWGLLVTLFLVLFFPHSSPSQDRPKADPQSQAPQLRLEKAVNVRHYNGKPVEGEERLIKPGDSLWQILIKEKGLSEKRFGRYVKIIEALNPRLRGLKTLPAGERVFIPHRPDELLGGGAPPKNDISYVYSVKPGDYLYKLLRERFGAESNAELRDALQQIKKLNPGKKDWKTLLAGEKILLPYRGNAEFTEATKSGKAIAALGSDVAKKIPVRQNVNLLEQIMGDLGNTVQKEGEEKVSVGQGKVRISLASYPMIRNPETARKVLLDLEGRISPSLRSEMEKTSSTVSVVTIKPGSSLHDIVKQLLSRLGFEFLPADRPVVVSESGMSIQVKGEWVVTAPNTAGDTQEVLVINLTDAGHTTPDYIKTYLSSRGTMLKEFLLPSAYAAPASPTAEARSPTPPGAIEAWPDGKEELVDALLKDFQISFSKAYKVSLTLKEGIQLDAQVDRIFEYGGKKIALFFTPISEEMKKTLGESEKAYPVDLDVKSLAPRDLIARILAMLGEKSAYQENRFPVSVGPGPNRLAITLSGFYLPDRSLLITDGKIPQPLQRFFLDKGLRVAYFH